MFARRTQGAMAVALALAVAGCAEGLLDDRDLDALDPNALVWVSPLERVAEQGEVLALVVSTRNPQARAVRFEVDGREVGVCDAERDADNCHVGGLWRLSTTIETTGMHELRASFITADGVRVGTRRDIEVVAEGLVPPVVDDGMLLPAREWPEADPEPTTPTTMEPAMMEPAMMEPAMMEPTMTSPPREMPPMRRPPLVHRGFRDPDRGWHRVFGGVEWRVDHMQVRLRDGTPRSGVAAIAACMRRYGASIRRYADRLGVSRAAVVATAITESNCTNPRGSSDGLSSGPMQVTATTCAAVARLPASVCRARMHQVPDFSFLVGVRYIASRYQRGQHRNDPPRIAAAYNAGSIRRTRANRWRMVTTGNHIDRWVRAYNAYHRWEEIESRSLTAEEPERLFDGEHVPSVDALPARATEGQTIFVGNWDERDGQFYEYVHGRWWSIEE